MSPPIAHCERYVIDGGRCYISPADAAAETGKVRPEPCQAATCPRLSEEVRGTMLACRRLLKAKRPTPEQVREAIDGLPPRPTFGGKR